MVSFWQASSGSRNSKHHICAPDRGVAVSARYENAEGGSLDQIGHLIYPVLSQDYDQQLRKFGLLEGTSTSSVQRSRACCRACNYCTKLRRFARHQSPFEKRRLARRWVMWCCIRLPYTLSVQAYVETFTPGQSLEQTSGVEI